MQQFKNIVFFTPILDAGGVERVFLTYAKELLKRGYNVSFLTVYDNGIFNNLIESLKIVSLHKNRLRNSIFSLIKYLRKTNIDVFITGGEISNAISILTVKFFGLKIKTIASHHNYFISEHNSLINKLIVKYIYRFSNVVLSVSDGITELLIQKGVKANKIKTIYNPVDCQSIKTLANAETTIDLPQKYIVFVGRLSPVKNLDLLLKSFSVLIKIFPEYKLVIVGDGALKNELQKKSIDLKIENDVYFTGSVSNPYPIIKNSSVVILPSFAEALPTVVLESFVLGKTVVSTPNKGAVDLLEQGKMGYIAPTFDDEKIFAQYIEKAILSPVSSAFLQSKVQEFDINNVISKLENLF